MTYILQFKLINKINHDMHAPHGVTNYTKINYVITLYRLHMTLGALTSQGSLTWAYNLFHKD